MTPPDTSSFVLGQRLAYAHAALAIGVASFVSLLGMEKAILAVVFGWLALRSEPGPALEVRRGWARAGVVLGVVMLITVPTALIVFRERVAELIELLGTL